MRFIELTATSRQRKKCNKIQYLNDLVDFKILMKMCSYLHLSNYDNRLIVQSINLKVLNIRHRTF